MAMFGVTNVLALVLLCCACTEGRRRHHFRSVSVNDSNDHSIHPAYSALTNSQGSSPTVMYTPGGYSVHQYRGASPLSYGSDAAGSGQPATGSDVSVEDQWKSHTIPFLKKAKAELDQGKIKHHNYEELTWFLKYFAEEYPEITRLYSIGTTVQNRRMWVMEISDEPGKHEAGEPEMKYIGNIHGNEVIGREILLQLVKTLCENYHKDEKVAALVDKTRIHILPSMNPDGYEMALAHRRSDLDDVSDDILGRLNANGVDLNRNFPDQFFEDNSDSYEPESTAVMNWLKQYPFTLSASFHSGALVVTYPFDDSPSGQSVYSSTPDDDVFRQIAKTYSESHPQMHLANPKLNCTRSVRRFTDGISNGAAWSAIAGGMQDYNYVRSNCFEVTVELGCRKFPREEEMARYWQENRQPLLNFIELANRGVRGFVRDENGKAIKGARISIGDRKHDVRSAEDGDYWRLLVPGTYDVECRAKGYKTKIQNVAVTTGDATLVNFTMEPKQVDGLEQALGHVNRATLLTHDLIYRYDGRDSGNSAPPAVIEHAKDQQVGREGVTEEQDTTTNDLDSLVGSGSGDEVAQAQKLAERLAINSVSVVRSGDQGGVKRRYFISPYMNTNEKRTKILKPAKHERSHKKSGPAHARKTSKKASVAQNKSDAITAGTAPQSGPAAAAKSIIINRTSALHNGTTAESEAISDDIVKSVEEKFHVKPNLGMHIKCKVPGKSDPLNGVLKYIGHISNLPKRSNVIVAGLELEQEEDLGTDGTFLGKRYFSVPAKRGYFIPVKNCQPV